MRPYGGYILWIDEPSREYQIRESIRVKDYFTEFLRENPFLKKERDIVFITFDGKTLSFIALCTSIGNLATARPGIKVFDCIELSEIAQYPSIESLFSDAFLLYPPLKIFDSNKESHQWNPSDWSSLISSLVERNPDLLDEIDRLHRIRVKEYAEEGQTIKVQRRDAVQLSFKLARIKPKRLFSFDRNDERERENQPERSSRGELFKSIPKWERDLVSHDQYNWPDWERLSQSPGLTEWKNGENVLRIWNVDGKPTETKTGVDLIYYNEYFDSFIMVQYKRMKQDVSGEWQFRPSEGNFFSQLDQMEKIVKRSSKTNLRRPDGNPSQYRFNSDAFFFKLCEEGAYNLNGLEMIQGMYLPFHYMDQLLESPDCKGENDGLLITKKNAQRYLNNTQFVDLVQHGWLGSKGSMTDIIEDIIQSSLNAKRAVVYSDFRKSE